MTERIVQDDNCFCCGKQNTRGLQLEYRYPEEGRAETECVIPDYFTGWKRITHGGLLAMLLDETMAHACISTGRMGVTAEMQIRFLRPATVGETVYVRAQIVAGRTRLLEARGVITNAAGEEVARASGRFVKV